MQAAGRSATIQTTRSTTVHQAGVQLNSGMADQEAKIQTNDKDLEKVHEMGRSEEKVPSKRRRGSLTGGQAHAHAADHIITSSYDSSKTQHAACTG